MESRTRNLAARYGFVEHTGPGFIGFHRTHSDGRRQGRRGWQSGVDAAGIRNRYDGGTTTMADRPPTEFRGAEDSEVIDNADVLAAAVGAFDRLVLGGGWTWAAAK